MQGSVEEVVEKYLNQELKPGQEVLVEGKVFVTSKGPGLEAEIDPNFGRAALFLIIDPRTMEFESVANPNSRAEHGAGIQSAQLVAGRSVSAVLAGQVGPNAQRVLNSTGISVIAVERCSVREAGARLRGR